MYYINVNFDIIARSVEKPKNKLNAMHYHIFHLRLKYRSPWIISSYHRLKWCH